eukprot:7998900-Karenia_brevis.AAC.1
MGRPWLCGWRTPGVQWLLRVLQRPEKPRIWRSRARDNDGQQLPGVTCMKCHLGEDETLCCSLMLTLMQCIGNS